MNYLMTISYDGSKFWGFQRLNEENSVQKCLENALSKINKKEVETINTIPLIKDSEDKIYINGELSDGIDTDTPNENENQNNNLGNNPNNNQNNNVDDTTAPGILPQTGTLPIIVLAISFVIIGVISYSRFKNIDK